MQVYSQALGIYLFTNPAVFEHCSKEEGKVKPILKDTDFIKAFWHKIVMEFT